MSIAARKLKTVGDVWNMVAPQVRASHLQDWPPDAFAVVGCILAESGAYRLVVSPPAGCQWPPATAAGSGTGVPRWEEMIRLQGQAWAAWAARRGPSRPPFPPVVQNAVSVMSAARAIPLNELTEPALWTTTTELLSLFAMADEACAGLLESGPTKRPVFPFHVRAKTRLARTGSASRLATDRVRVLPKFRVPPTGITMRSMSRHVAFEHSEVSTTWLESFSVERPNHENRFTMLLLPWPDKVAPKDFKRVHPGTLVNMSQDRYGFFEYDPEEPFDHERALELVRAARKRVGTIDMVVLPECAVQEKDAKELRTALLEEGVPFFLAGVRASRDSWRGVPSGPRFGANYAYLAGVRSDGSLWDLKQYKHHRWFIDKSQIEQYHLGPVLDPRKGWWEAIDVGERGLNFVGIRDWLVLSPLICEDLARPDPVANLIRSVGPSLVIALLFDGPQLSSRWPSRYATVLADDPGSAVLTFSSLGFVRRCLPRGQSRSRVVALWKDAAGQPYQIELEDGSEAIALTLAASSRTGVTADGRTEDGSTADVSLSGIEQIRRVRVPVAGGGPDREFVGIRPNDSDDVAIVTEDDEVGENGRTLTEARGNVESKVNDG